MTKGSIWNSIAKVPGRQVVLINLLVPLLSRAIPALYLQETCCHLFLSAQIKIPLVIFSVILGSQKKYSIGWEYTTGVKALDLHTIGSPLNTYAPNSAQD